MKIILKERDNESLIKIENFLQIGARKYKAVKYKWWTNKEKMNKKIVSEKIDGEQYIYCSKFAGYEEEALLKIFGSNINDMPHNIIEAVENTDITIKTNGEVHYKTEYKSCLTLCDPNPW
ncbi:hypothetical protein [Clostridium estertheticum]|uniref:hypothetical protein n=1 Tax=Clostridium estertheticum TaxID=238834 RepID=UPI001C0E5E41|nr:hypothetical protein [Clostridium estertheticum]MBU3173371.1 hypothetical protein [Clostridium estertheticum]